MEIKRTKQLSYSLPDTNRSHLKNSWSEDEISFLGWPIFRGELLVSESVSHCIWLVKVTDYSNWKVLNITIHMKQGAKNNLMPLYE